VLDGGRGTAGGSYIQLMYMDVGEIPCYVRLRRVMQCLSRFILARKPFEVG